VHALAFQRVEVDRQGRDQGLALAGAHLGDLARVQHHAADQLHVVVAHAEHAAAASRDREGLGQQRVERLAGGHARRNSAVLACSAASERLHRRLEGVDLRRRSW
jgi:hypothetical protein